MILPQRGLCSIQEILVVLRAGLLAAEVLWESSKQLLWGRALALCSADEGGGNKYLLKSWSTTKILPLGMSEGHRVSEVVCLHEECHVHETEAAHWWWALLMTVAVSLAFVHAGA